MAVKALRLDCISLNVRDLAVCGFYTEALGFAVAGPVRQDQALAALLGARGARSVRLQRGDQFLELVALEPPGDPYPARSRSNDLWFQHIALVTSDMGAAYARLCRHAFTPISQATPVALPGGIVAFKFRDPEMHPLELIQFPKADPATAEGIDHSAIAVAEAARSIAFYRERLGLALSARQINRGPAQAALDDLEAPELEVVALAPMRAAPHVELLAYRSPIGRRLTLASGSLAATRLVFATPAGAGVLGEDAARPSLIRDPDGHMLHLRPDMSTAVYA
jgi:catechol 2,3-dioxygenase-like lactoylglutathione lyase family enzyme